MFAVFTNSRSCGIIVTINGFRSTDGGEKMTATKSDKNRIKDLAPRINKLTYEQKIKLLALLIIQETKNVSK